VARPCLRRLRYCRTGSENLCDRPLFTGYTRDGGFATLVVADAGFAFDLGDEADPVALVPLLCAGLSDGAR
jgi:propanol-preferring alcohol dehydrogenase